MASQDGEDVRRAEKVGLKRKLTGPPRLLLGKTRSRSVTEDRAEAHTNRDTTETLKHPTAAESATATVLTHAANMEEGAENERSGRGRCEAAGEDDDIRNRKSNRRRWWRRFSAALICNRKQEKDAITGSAKQQSPASTEGVLQQTDAVVMNDAEGDGQKGRSERKKTVTVTTWTTFRRFLTSSTRTREQRIVSVEKDGDQTPLTIHKKLQKFFTRGSKSRLSGVTMETVEDVSKREDMMKCEDVMKHEDTPCSPGAQVDEPNELLGDVTVGSGQVVTVTAEMTQLTEEQAADEEQLVCDVTEEDVTDAGGSETIHAEVDEHPADTADAPPEDLPAEEDHLSAASSSPPPPPPQGSELHCDEETDNITSQAHQTNGPSIWIELVPPDDVNQEDEDEVEEEQENQNHHLFLLLLDCDHSEQQLLRTARSLVRAALNAAVDQLTREQLSDSDCVLREPLGCRDHA